MLLLEYGDLKMRKARVAFSMNFFAAAGFEIVTAFAEADPAAAAKVIAGAEAGPGRAVQRRSAIPSHGAAAIEHTAAIESDSGDRCRLPEG